MSASRRKRAGAYARCYGAPMRNRGAEGYWDRRARENALYFVDSQLSYREPNAEAFWQGGEEALEKILESVGASIAPTDHVIDIGCGVGRLTRALARRGDRVTAIDVSAEMLTRARELNAHLDNVVWAHGDGASLQPIEDASVDGCFSHVVFQHIPDPEITLGYIHEMGRVLRPGGWTIFVLSSDPRVHQQRPTARHRLRSLIGRAPRGGDHPAWLGSSVDPERVRATAEQAGLEVRALLAPGTQYTTVYAVRKPA